jgi:GrpB-like predicted nucleotidyltransferase (UPF0157 family)
MKKVEVVAHNPLWRDEFQTESGKIAGALGENVVAVNHIGSTSIPDIFAKPIVDILVEVRDIAKVDESGSGMQSLGYEALGEYGIAGRRYFRKNNSDGVRTHHVHTFEAGSAASVRHLAFRDYLIAHPLEAQKYSELKQILARQFPQDMDAYIDGKDAFVKEIERRALAWRETARN